MNKQKIAKELCQKDGKDWDELSDAEKHGYEHYADVVMRKEAQPMKEGKAKPGHSHAQVETEPEVIIEPEELTDKLADEPEPEPEDVGEPAESDTPDEPTRIPDGKYLCTKCSGSLHKLDSKIGKRHLKYKV